jgi:undecaprenyl-diphosphatase
VEESPQVQGEGPLVATAVVATGTAGLTVGVLQLVRFTAPPPEQLADQVAEEVKVAAERTGITGFIARRIHPLEATGVALTAALLSIVAAVAVFGGMAILGTRTHLWVVDALGARWGSDNAGPASTRVLELITDLGGTMVAFPLTAAVAGWLLYRYKRLGPPLFLVSVMLGQSVVHNLVKLIVHRPRPPVPPLTGWAGYSFPSGHSATAAAMFCALALLLSRGRSRPVSIALGAAGAGLAAMVAASRVLLGVHWVTDVAAGLALGFLWFAACALAFGGRRLRLADEPRIGAADREGPAAGGFGQGRRGTPRAGRSDQRAGATGTETTVRRTMTETTGPPVPEREPDPGPTDEQVEARADALEAEPGNQSATAPERQARSLLEESESRVEDDAARVPGDARVIHRGADEGVDFDEGGGPSR